MHLVKASFKLKMTDMGSATALGSRITQIFGHHLWCYPNTKYPALCYSPSLIQFHQDAIRPYTKQYNAAEMGFTVVVLSHLDKITDHHVTFGITLVNLWIDIS